VTTYFPHEAAASNESGGSAPGTGALSLSDAAGRNRIIAALPSTAAESLLAEADLVDLALRDCLFEVGDTITHVHFPISAVTSVVTVMSDGSAVETATVGSEGMVGLTAVLGVPTANSRAFAQVPGLALRVPAATLSRLASAHDGVDRVLSRYVLARLAQVSQTVACNRLHDVERRCARWLLMTHDRVATDQFPMTQDFLAQMLGVRRATVSLVASALQRRGLIGYRRGHMRILDRRGLEEASCECYAIVRERQARLLG
jgi:CRP-like cAMP-binding protein